MIFDRFYKSDEFEQGSGLPTCKVIIEKLSGRIEVHSEVGKGSCLTLSQTLKVSFLKISGHTSATAPLQLPCNPAPKWNISVVVMTVKHMYTSLISRYHEIVNPTSPTNASERFSTTFQQDKKNP